MSRYERGGPKALARPTPGVVAAQFQGAVITAMRARLYQWSKAITETALLQLRSTA